MNNPAGHDNNGKRISKWLFKSEPDTWSWAQQCATDQEHWDGVRSFQARNNMRLMKVGDLGFFYHSNKERQIVGVVKVVREYYPDHTDPTGKFDMVDIAAVKSVDKPLTLTEMKANPALSEMALVTHSRLSVSPIRDNEWDVVCAMLGIDPAELDK